MPAFFFAPEDAENYKFILETTGQENMTEKENLHNLQASAQHGEPEMKKDAQQVLQKLIDFLQNIGISTRITQDANDCFLPGLTIENGELLINPFSQYYPGDILHEAGHLAVIPAAERATANAARLGARPQREAEEMMAICWSYAACVHLGLPATFVFHADGYRGGGSSLAESFTNGVYIGLPMLQWIGLAYDEQQAAAVGAPPFPAMRQWLRD